MDENHLWQTLRAHTAARIALWRRGVSVPLLRGEKFVVDARRQQLSQSKLLKADCLAGGRHHE